MGQSTEQIFEPFRGTHDANAAMPAADIEKLRVLTEKYDATRVVEARRALRRMILLAIPITLVLGLVGLVAAALAERRFGPDGLFPAAGVTFGLWLLVMASLKFFIGGPVRLTELAFWRELMPALFAFVRRLDFYDGGCPSEIERLASTRLFTFLHSTHRRTLTGDFEGLPFMVTQTELVRGRVKVAGVRHQLKAFEGIVVRLPPPDAFSGTLLLRSRSPGGFQLPPDPSRGKCQLVTSGNAELDRRLTFFSDRPDAHVSIIERVRQMTVSIMETTPHQQLHLAITNADCFVLLAPSHGLVALPDLDTPIDVDRHLLPFAADLRNLLAVATAFRAAASPLPAN